MTFLSKRVATATFSKSPFTLLVSFASLLALFAISEAVLAGGGSGKSLGDVAGTVTESMTNVAKLITAASYVAGVGFALMGMLKLKAHKDNPTQVPLSQPIVLLAISAGLVFLPSLIRSGGQTVWGGGQEAAESTGKSGSDLGGGGG